MPPKTTTTTTTTTTATSDWRDSYLTSLQEAERDSPVNRDLAAACSALADRVAALEAENAVLALHLQQQQQPPPPTTTTTTTLTPTPNPPPPTTTPAAAAAQARRDLAEALRSKGRRQARLRAAEEELRRLRGRSRSEERRARELAAERAALAARLKDRGEELVEKSRMVNRFQDEIVALTMELNLTVQKNQRVAAENKELVDRWMKRMGEEADAMNLQNEPMLNNRR